MNPQCTYVCGPVHTQAYPISPDVWHCQLRHSSRSSRLSLLFCVTADQSLVFSFPTACRLSADHLVWAQFMFHSSVSTHTVHIHMELQMQNRAYRHKWPIYIIYGSCRVHASADRCCFGSTLRTGSIFDSWS